MNKPDYCRLLLLALYAGPRLDDLVNLPLGRITKTYGVSAFDIQGNVANNPNSIRRVPISGRYCNPVYLLAFMVVILF
ncbi:hypothetical protein [Burkholderia ubonensis]|uniref:hypothetical protein n=1 Tax=Burkholderia ubonensis TaxID=101571 RepID=UPI000AD9DEAA|nr:hypothetical protein [Burkholderia ubonensis]